MTSTEHDRRSDTDDRVEIGGEGDAVAERAGRTDRPGSAPLTPQLDEPSGPERNAERERRTAETDKPDSEPEVGPTA